MRCIHLLLSLLIACREGSPLPDEEALTSATRLTYAAQGWSEAQREGFHFTSQGGAMLPYDLFITVEQADATELFTAENNLRSFGLLVDGKSDGNPDGLPIGFVKNEYGLGVTCAACHTAEVRRAGKTLRIDGGQGFTDIGELMLALADAFEATLADSDKLARMAQRLGETTQALQERLEPFSTDFANFARQGRGQRRLGFGRADTTSFILNSAICLSMDISENCADALAPSIAPNIWLTPQLDWVQTNGNQHIPVVRDMLQALLFAAPRRQADGSFTHQINVANLRTLEGLLTELTPPAWPEDMLGAIDHDKAARGEVLYAANCESCHARMPYPMTPANSLGKSLIAVTMTPAAEVGTDPTFVQRYLGRRANPGPLATAFMPADIGPDGKVVAVKLTSAMFAPILSATLAPLSSEEKAEFFDQRESVRPTLAQLQSYKAGPLAGVALSGYFLHNGSVRTLYQLLLPPNERETLFYVGSREFDPVQVGYVSDASAVRAYAFDTSLPGDANTGHSYGTSLSNAERYDLIEYLKTL